MEFFPRGGCSSLEVSEVRDGVYEGRGGTRKKSLGGLNYKLEGPRNIINIYNYKYKREGHFFAGAWAPASPPSLRHCMRVTLSWGSEKIMDWKKVKQGRKKLMKGMLKLCLMALCLTRSV